MSVLACLVHIIGAPNVTPDLQSVATNLVATTHTLSAYTLSTTSIQGLLYRAQILERPNSLCLQHQVWLEGLNLMWCYPSY